MAQSDDFLANLARSGRTRIAAALAVTALVGGGLGAVMLRAGGAEQALLYSGLDLTEAAEIAGRLDTAGLKYDLRGDGSAIFVDRSKVNDARIMLSAEGLPTKGSVGYEIFDKQDALGATTFVQNINRVRALEGELSRTIASLSNVKSARVHLVLPERRLFDRDAQAPTASIVIDVVGRALDPSQVRAVRNLAAGAVPGLLPESVTLLDAEGRLLATAANEDSLHAGGLTSDERRAAFEETLRAKVLSQIEPIVGAGAARVQISADMDFNRVTQSSELYDPDSRVVRSTQVVEESSSEQNREDVQTVTAENNIPTADGADTETADTSQMATNRVEETVNYEISRTTKTEIIEGGAIRRLSVAVAVDHNRVPGVPDDEGNLPPPTYEARSDAELAQIAALVRSAIGYEQARGDVVEVVNVRFAAPAFDTSEIKPPGPLDFDKNDIMRGVEVFALLLGGLALILFVLRPLVSGLIKPEGNDSNDEDGEDTFDPLSAEYLEQRGLTADQIAAITGNADELGDKINVANIAGKVKASSMQRIAEMVEKRPDESVAILRAWLNDAENKAA